MMKTVILLLLMVTLNSGCINTMIKAPDAKIRAITPDQAGKWAEKNKSEPHARLFTVHSEDMKGIIKFLVGLGVDVDVVKDGDGK